MVGNVAELRYLHELEVVIGLDNERVPRLQLHFSLGVDVHILQVLGGLHAVLSVNDLELAVLDFLPFLWFSITNGHDHNDLTVFDRCLHREVLHHLGNPCWFQRSACRAPRASPER